METSLNFVKATVVILSFGLILFLRSEHGIEVNYMRIRALPFTSHLKEFVGRCKRVYSVEQNRDGQMGDLIRLEVEGDQDKIVKILHYQGLPLDARFITDQVIAHEKGKGK